VAWFIKELSLLFLIRKVVVFALILVRLGHRLSVTEVVHAIQSFGQEDDISMIALTRTAEMAPA
jgi:hypothetical protein